MSATQIDMSDVVNSPEFAQNFQILRGPGSWLNGVWKPTTAPILGFGTVTVATSRDIDMIPEGDRVTGAMVFHSQQPIYGTHADANGQGASSDIITWRDHQYRVLKVGPFEDFGYYRAVATRLKSA